MPADDHRKTASWGSSHKAVAYRAQQAALIQQGQWKAAIQMDIMDIRGKFGPKYNQAIAEMVAHEKKEGRW